MNPIEHLKENTLRYLNKWTRPDSYGGCTWEDHYVFLSRTRDSGALERSNFECAQKALEEISPEYDGALSWGDGTSEVEPWSVVHEGHCFCGWIEWIAIHKDATKHLECAAEIACALEDYPVVDEEHFCQVETDEAESVWRDCFDSKERVEYMREHRGQFEGDWQSLLDNARGKYFSGYANELIN